MTRRETLRVPIDDRSRPQFRDAPSGRKRGRKLTPADTVGQVKEVYRLTQDSRGQGNLRETARICRVAWHTVKKIIDGSHGQPSQNLADKLAPFERSVDAHKCPDCGGVIDIVPCRRCRISAATAENQEPQELAAAANRSGPANPRRRRPEARGQLRLPLTFEHVGPEFDPDIPPAENRRSGFELTSQHAARLAEVRRRRRMRPIVDELPF